MFTSCMSGGHVVDHRKCSEGLCGLRTLAPQHSDPLAATSTLTADFNFFHCLNKSSAVAEMGDRARWAEKWGGAAVPLSVEEAGSPSNTMTAGPRPTSAPSGILIHPTAWPQYTNVTDRQTGQAKQTTVP